MPTQAEISRSYGMPTYSEVDCIGCEYEGYMVMSETIDGVETCTCLECDFQQPVDGIEAM